MYVSYNLKRRVIFGSRGMEDAKKEGFPETDPMMTAYEELDTHW